MTRLTLITLAGLGITVACSSGSDSGAGRDSTTTSPATGAAAVTGARIGVPRTGPAGEWQMPAGDYANSRYSELDQITPANVGNLHASWTFSTGVLRGHEGQPLVVNNTMGGEPYGAEVTRGWLEEAGFRAQPTIAVSPISAVARAVKE